MEHITPVYLGVRGLSGKYPSILNISRTDRVALIWLGSQSGKTLLRVHEQLLSRGTSQSAVRRRWLSLCTVWPSHSQWPIEQISFITTLHLPILQMSCRLFFGKASHHPGRSASLQPRFGSLRLIAFPKAKIAVERTRFVDATVTQYTSAVNVVSLPTD